MRYVLIGLALLIAACGDLKHDGRVDDQVTTVRYPHWDKLWNSYGPDVYVTCYQGARVYTAHGGGVAVVAGGCRGGD